MRAVELQLPGPSMWCHSAVFVLFLQGVSTHIKLKAAGELQDSGKREVYFEANGVPRVVEVVDKKSTEVLGKAAIREKVSRHANHFCCMLQQSCCSPLDISAGFVSTSSRSS